MGIKKKISIDNLNEKSIEELINVLKNIRIDDDGCNIYVCDKKKFRTNNFNRYYWGVVLSTIKNTTGYHTDELHQMFKTKFALQTRFSFNSNSQDAIIEEYPKSTKMMTTKEMNDYVEKVRNWAKEFLNEYIPLPNEMTEEQYIEAMNR